MRTVRSSSHVYPSMHWAGCVCVCVYPSMHWEAGCLPGGGVSAWGYIPACTEADNPPPPPWTEFLTHASEKRMHSSRMRTTCLLAVSQHALLGLYLPGRCTWWGVYLPGGVPGRGCTCPGGGCTCPGTPLPLWTEWQTAAKILPCPKLRLRAVIITLPQLRCGR